MNDPALCTGPAFWIEYFRRKRTRRRWWQRLWRARLRLRCALCGERVSVAAFGSHVVDRHPVPPR